MLLDTRLLTDPSKRYWHIQSLCVLLGGHDLAVQMSTWAGKQPHRDTHSNAIVMSSVFTLKKTYFPSSTGYQAQGVSWLVPPSSSPCPDFVWLEFLQVLWSMLSNFCQFICASNLLCLETFPWGCLPPKTRTVFLVKGLLWVSWADHVVSVL